LGASTIMANFVSTMHPAIHVYQSNKSLQTNSLHASRKLLRAAASAPHSGCR
jgi:hypothetical protein